MAQPSGFSQPIDALLAVQNCLLDFTILNQAGTATLTPEVFLGDEGVGGYIDCCPNGVLRIESTGEIPTQGLPLNLGKHGCIELTMGVRVTFLVCFQTATKSGTVVTNPTDLAYTRTIQASRWEAIEILRCCTEPAARQALKFVNSTPIGTDGKCSGWQIDLQAALSLCNDCSDVIQPS